MRVRILLVRVGQGEEENKKSEGEDGKKREE